jgi:alpha-ketoglutarate-dependent 2,4-dichlorophenoxyacetate dioxygenase
MQIRQVGPGFVAEVSDIDIAKPLAADTIAAIHAAMAEHAVLIFRGQSLDPDQQLAFSESLGPLEHAIGTALRSMKGDRLPTTFADISNLDENNQRFARDDRRRLFGIGNRLWHSDSSFKAVPAKYSLLYASTVTSKGGNTEFANMRRAYDTLDDDTKELIEDLVCEHSLLYSRGILGFEEYSPEEVERFKPVLQRLVRRHPATGLKSLFLSSHIGGITGWSMPEARAFIMDLTELATTPDNVHAHKWQIGDLVMWDNQQTMHRARAYPHEETRDMRRTTLAGDGPTVDQQAA